MLPKRKSLKGSSHFALKVVWALLGRGGAVAAGFVATALLTRLLSPAEVGVYYLAQSVVVMVGPLASLSLQQPTIGAIAAARAVGDHARAAAFARAGLRLALLSGFAISGLGVVGWMTADHFGFASGFDRWPVILLTAVWLVTLAFESQLVGVLLGLERIGATAAFDAALGKVLSMIALLVLWLGPGAKSVVTVLAVFVASECVSVILAMIVVHRAIAALGTAGTPVPAAELWSKAWPFLISQLSSSVILQSGVLILGLFRSPAEVAIYGTASRLSALLTLPGTIINVPLAPSVARLHAQGRHKEMQSLLQYSTIAPSIIAIAATLILFAFGDEILERLFGKVYRNGELVMIILSVGQCVNIILGSSLLVLAMAGKQHIVAWIGAVVGGIQVLVLFFVASPFGAAGVALCTAIEPCLLKSLGWVAAYRTLGVYTHFPVASLPKISLGLLQRIAGSKAA